MCFLPIPWNLPYTEVDKQLFTQSLETFIPPVDVMDIDSHISWINNTLNEVARKRPQTNDNNENPIWDIQQDRWTRVVNCGDAKTI